jgi:hypothetical protein
MWWLGLTSGGVGAEDVVGVLDAEGHDEEEDCFGAGCDVDAADHGAGAGGGGGLDFFHDVGADFEPSQDGLGVGQAQEHHQRGAADAFAWGFHEVREDELRRLVVGDDGQQRDADDHYGNDLEPCAYAAQDPQRPRARDRKAEMQDEQSRRYPAYLMSQPLHARSELIVS